jgi:RNA polymerase sigma-70 factor (ECF subfamily)
MLNFIQKFISIFRFSKIRILNNSPTDIELVTRLQQGDIEAFDLMYDKYASRLYGFGLKYLKSADEAEELVQSVFLKLWETHYNLKKELSFKSYLFTIAYNNICKIFRDRYYWRKFAESSYPENAKLAAPDIEDGMSYQAVLDRVQQIVNKLPEKQRAVFMKSKIEGKSAKEIARDVNLSPRTVDNYISEILKHIRSNIHDGDIGLILYFSIFLS